MEACVGLMLKGSVKIAVTPLFESP